MNIAIIPARKNSVRIKNKNIKIFKKKPIIFWTIKKIKESKIFDKIFVSTDSRKIAEIAKKYGAEVPFLRPKNLAKDQTPIKPVICHTINFLQKRGMKIKNVCCLFPASPFISKKNLIFGLKKIRSNNNIHFVFPAQKIDKIHARSFFITNKKLNLLYKKFENYNSQKIPELYIDAGQFYWATSKNWLSKNIFSKNSRIIKLKTNESIDINTMFDWKKALKM